MYPIADSKPTIYLNQKDLPCIKDLKVGEEIEVVAKLRMRSKSDYGNELSSSFEVVDIQVPEDDDQDISEMSNEEFRKHMAEQNRKLYENS